MATRSAIAIRHGETIKGVYAHWDGYVAHNGYILENFYNDSVKVNKLISMGDISALGADIGEKHDFHNNDKEYIDTPAGVSISKECTFYNRDRGEDTTWQTFKTPGEFVKYFKGSWCEYFYLFDNGIWKVRGRDGRWKRVSEALKTAH